MRASINVKMIKRCAFCKYWYDPTNSILFPKNPKIGIWEIIDTDKKNKCIKTNFNRRAGDSGCMCYECKI